MAVPSLSSLPPQAIHEIAVKAKEDLCSSERMLAAYLLEIERRQLFFDWGVSCTLDYAELILGFAAHTAREMMRMARALDGLPGLADAYYGGRIPASKMREITRVAVRETEDLWIEKAANHNTRQIEMMVARTSKGERPGSVRPDDKRPRPVRSRLRLDLTPEQMAIVLEAAELVTKIAGERVGLSEAVELMAQDFLSTAHREEDVRNRYRLIIHCDPAAKLAWVNTRRGPLRVSDETIEQALCDAEILDTREQEQPVERAAADDGDDEESEKPVSDVETARPTWDIGTQPVVTSGEAPGCDPWNEPPTWDVTDNPNWDLPEEDEPDAWALLNDVAAGLRTRSGAAGLARTVPPAVLRHVMARDQYCCSVPGCTMRIWKEVHHIKWRMDGGNHDLDNLALTCKRHHRMLHNGALSVSGSPSTGLIWKDRQGRILQGSPGAIPEPAYFSPV